MFMHIRLWCLFYTYRFIWWMSSSDFIHCSFNVQIDGNFEVVQIIFRSSCVCVCVQNKQKGKLKLQKEKCIKRQQLEIMVSNNHATNLWIVASFPFPSEHYCLNAGYFCVYQQSVEYLLCHYLPVHDARPPLFGQAT